MDTELDTKIRKTIENCEMLRHTFNTINALIAERDKTTGLAYVNAFTLAGAGKVVYDRWEQERRKLSREDLLRVNKSLLREDFFPEELPFPEELREKIGKEIRQSPWYKITWGTGPK